MGKGKGCCASKNQKNVLLGTVPPKEPRVRDAENAETEEREIPTETGSLEVQGVVDEPTTLSQKLKVYIIFYSLYGHVEALAKKIKAGIDSVEGVEGHLFRVQETLPESILQQMQAPPKDESIPVISASELLDADALIFGFPTRFGAMAAQMKTFFDSTGQLWRAQQLAGKPAGLFVSSGTQGGGQETTAWTALTQLVHHGMLFVPIGYTFGAGMFKMEEVRGGSPYGAGTF
eukprot:c22756_g1_i1 orf=1-693(-)